jgi:SAM-dependent methyltransferase
MFIYASTIAVSAFLLFLVQPIIAKQILPWFGGSAAVWTTCMVFFQLVLLAGYFYSDLVINKLKPKAQAITHGALVIVSLAFLPITASSNFKPTDADNPIGKILLLLLVTIGMPYFLLSTTGPLIQAWFSKAMPSDDQSKKVYRLYALSNVASMLALIAYPPLIEPNSNSIEQSIGWSAGYGLFALLVLICAWKSRNLQSLTINKTTADSAALTDSGAPPTLALQGLWLLLAALGSLLLLSITTHITQNVASIPFMWVLPLAIYLVTFILCFDGNGWYFRKYYTVLAAIFTVLMIAGLVYRPTDTFGFEKGLLHIEHAIPLYALGLFILCMYCHGELVTRKPTPTHLTRFYLMVSLGGAVGGLLGGIVAPLFFDYYWEFPLALCAVAALGIVLAPGKFKFVATAATIACAIFYSTYNSFVRDDTLSLSRNFYGTLRVKATGPDSEKQAKWRLMHGVITHGEQFRSPEWRSLATSYYGESSGIGKAIMGLRGDKTSESIVKSKPQKIGLIGLGVGTLATYGRTGDTYRIYELNPEVLTLAQRRFTYLSSSAAKIETALGDARLVLEKEPSQQFDVLAIDAFSSDSIPVHLITREAMAVYKRHLKPDGVIAFHISNRYLDLTGVTKQLAKEAGMRALQITDDPGDDSYLYRSDWVLVTNNSQLFHDLKNKGLGKEFDDTVRLQPWTDSFNNLFEVLK